MAFNPQSVGGQLTAAPAAIFLSLPRSADLGFHAVALTSALGVQSNGKERGCRRVSRLENTDTQAKARALPGRQTQKESAIFQTLPSQESWYERGQAALFPLE